MALTEERTDSSHRREELRGLFALGVVAVLAAVEVSPQSFGIADKLSIPLPFVNESLTFPFSTFFNVIIFSWVGYAMLMVFAYSDDLFPSEMGRKVIKILGLGLLVLGPLLFGAISLTVVTMAYFIAYYPSSIYVAIFAPIMFTIVIILLMLRSKYRIRIERR
jgi:hypothetical protein